MTYPLIACFDLSQIKLGRLDFSRMNAVHLQRKQISPIFRTAMERRHTRFLSISFHSFCSVALPIYLYNTTIQRDTMQTTTVKMKTWYSINFLWDKNEEQITHERLTPQPPDGHGTSLSPTPFSGHLPPIEIPCSLRAFKSESPCNSHVGQFPPNSSH